MIGLLIILVLIVLFLLKKPTPNRQLYKKHFEDQDDFEDFMEADSDAYSDRSK